MAIKIIDLAPTVEGRAVMAITDLPEHLRFQLSDEAKRDLEEIRRNHHRALATAHLYWFD